MVIPSAGFIFFAIIFAYIWRRLPPEIQVVLYIVYFLALIAIAKIMLYNFGGWSLLVDFAVALSEPLGGLLLSLWETLWTF